MNRPQSNISTASVCCLVGLPGCGKSTLARRIVELYEEEQRIRVQQPSCGDRQNINNHASNVSSLVSRFDKILIIDYDAIARQELAQYVCHNSTNKDKDANPQNAPYDSNDLEAWRKGRVRALDTLKEALINHFTKEEASSLLILMDDNFHLRSMRRDIYRACQELLQLEHSQYIIGFSTVYLSTPREVCLQRNNLRNGKEHIPANVIDRMALTIEPPDESKPYASFECFHVSHDNSNNDEITKGCKIFQEINQCIQKSIQYPILPKKEPTPEEIVQMEQQRTRQREETLKCQMQTIDQLLRKLVGAVGRVEKTRSKDANNARKSIMEKVRTDISIGGDMSNESVVELFVCSILGIDTNKSDWHACDSPMVRSIKYAFQQFQQDRGTV